MNFWLARCGFVGAILVAISPNMVRAQAASFSAYAEVLPFPPDAREVEFDATFDDIEYTSGSSLPALVAFYRSELNKLGWKEDKSAAESDDESAEMTFNHEGAQVVIELDAGSDEVSVSMDCEGLDFSRTSDPTALIAAGVPQPRAYVFLQKELPRPADVQDQQYGGDSCHFKSSLTLQAAFDSYGKALKEKGWRESRKPIITADRRYTEFTRGHDEVSVNVFADPVGSRIILGYETETEEPVVPPLPEVGQQTLVGSPPGTTKEAAPAAPAAVAVNVAKNTGTATVTLEGKKYNFKHAAAYRTKQNGDASMQLLFADRPIPLQRIQELIVKEDDFGISEIYDEMAWPGHLSIDFGQYINFSFNSGGTGVGNSIDDPVNDIKVTKDRVRGSLKMREPIEVFDDSMYIEVTIDAAILTPSTRIAPAAAK